MERTTEVELARRLLAGEPRAFDEFVEHFRGKVFKYSWLMCGQREDAEDVAQETLLKVFQSFSQLRDPTQVRPWVFRIAKNACFMKRRKSIFAPREVPLEEFYPAVLEDGRRRHLEIADWSLLPEEALRRSELREILEQAIVRLPGIYRAVVLLRDVEDLSTEETAQVLNLSIEVVKARLHRGRLAIRQKLDSYLHGAGKRTGKFARNDETQS